MLAATIFLAAEETMRKLFVVAAFALYIESLGFAASAAIISGTIKDADGSLFRAAFVRVQNVKTKMTMMVLSDSNGRYFTDRLDAGTYDVWATSLGYKSDRRRAVTLEDGSALTLDFA